MPTMEDYYEELDLNSLGRLPVGLGLRPTDLELVNYYLVPKNDGSLLPNEENLIQEVKVYKFDPWVLADKARFETGDPVWHFFSRRGPRNAGACSDQNGHFGSLTTPYGFWWATGDEQDIRETPWSPPIGKKRTLVFYLCGENGNTRTSWTIEEYTTFADQDLYVLCRLIKSHEDVLPGSMALISSSYSVPAGGVVQDGHVRMASSSTSHATVEAEADSWHNTMCPSNSNPVTVEEEAEDVESCDNIIQFPDSVIDFIDNDDYTYSFVPLEAFWRSASQPDLSNLPIEESLQNVIVEQSEGIHSNDVVIITPISNVLDQHQSEHDSSTELQRASRIDPNNIVDDAYDEASHA